MSPYPNTPESTHQLISEASRPEIGMSAKGDIQYVLLEILQEQVFKGTALFQTSFIEKHIAGWFKV